MTLSDFKDIAAIVVGVIAGVTLIKGVVEYVHQGAQKRAERYFEFEKTFLENEEFKKICELLETDDRGLADVDFKAKLHFLGFYEQVALMLNSKLIRPAVAHYMFGYFAILCWESKHFWTDRERNSLYWSLFASFAQDMKKAEVGFRLDNRALRF